MLRFSSTAIALNRRISMSKIVDEVIAANKKYASDSAPRRTWHSHQHGPSRNSDLHGCAPLQYPRNMQGSPGDAHVIRNAGGRATDDAIRSLVISHKLLGTESGLSSSHKLRHGTVHRWHHGRLARGQSGNREFWSKSKAWSWSERRIQVAHDQGPTIKHPPRRSPYSRTPAGSEQYSDLRLRLRRSIRQPR